MKLTLKVKILFTLSFSMWTFGFAAEALAQFETETPTFTATPRAFVTGTPEISTVWLGINVPSSSQKTVNPIPNPTSNISVISSASLPDDAVPAPSQTPQTESNAGLVKPPSTANASNGLSVGVGALDSGYPVGTGKSKPFTESASVNSLLRSNNKTSAPMGLQKKGLGLSKMMDFYQAGIKNYKNKNFESAIRYLKKAISIKDRSVPFYYYAEANAMLGVIYKFDLVDLALAHQYCETALKIDPSTKTAKKLIHEIEASNTNTEKTYWLGIRSYENGDDDSAIRFLTSVIHKNDPTTPSFYFAEAYKTLGFIYQFHRTNINQARLCYQAALKIEPADEIAKRNLIKILN